MLFRAHHLRLLALSLPCRNTRLARTLCRRRLRLAASFLSQSSLSSRYWGDPALADVCSLETCAKYCTGNATCKAFEVYLLAPPDQNQSNCYLFADLSQPFTELDPCETYVKTTMTTTTSTKMAAEAIALVEPHSTLEYYALSARARALASNDGSEEVVLHPTAAVYKRALEASGAVLSDQQHKAVGDDEPSVLALAWTELMKVRWTVC